MTSETSCGIKQSFSHLIGLVHGWAVLKGWWEGGVEKRSFGDQMANFHGELSEAWEEYRKYGMDKEKFFYANPDDSLCLPIPEELREEYVGVPCTTVNFNTSVPTMRKPEGIAAELADLVIRIVDTCGAYDIDLADAIIVKMKYNQLRGYRHGNKKA